MGKEIKGQKRNLEFAATSSNYADQKYIEQIIAQNWINQPTNYYYNTIIEDGSAVVTVKISEKEVKMQCKGLKSSGNKFKDLTKLLKSNNLIPKRMNIGLYVKRKFVWEEVNGAKDSFNANDSILVVNMPRKKSIRKVPIERDFFIESS